MNILAIDSATTTLKLHCVTEKGSVVKSIEGSRKHSELAVPAIEDLLNQAALQTSALQAIVVGIGPGMFTGVRVAITMAQALAFALNIPLFTTSSLAWYAAGLAAGDSVWVIQDARKNEFYAALFQMTDSGLKMQGNHVCLAEDKLKTSIMASASQSITGDGVALLQSSHTFHTIKVPSKSDEASWLRQWVAFNEPTAPQDALPIYLRDAV